MEHVQPRLPYEYLLHAACDCCKVLARDCERVNCTNNNEAIFISVPKAFRACSKFATINNPGRFLECVHIPCFGTCMPPSTPLSLGTCVIPSQPNQGYKRANLLRSFLVPPQCLSCKPECHSQGRGQLWVSDAVLCKHFRCLAGLRRGKEQHSLNWETVCRLVTFFSWSPEVFSLTL